MLSIEFCTKRSVGAYVYLQPEWSYGAPKIAIFWNIIMFKNEKVDSLWAERCWKYALYPKLLQIKVVNHWILYKKVSRRICLSPPSRVDIGGSKDCHLLKYYNVQKRGSRFTLWLDAEENTHYIQKCFKWRKSRSQGLLMFSNVFEKLS